MNYRDLFELDRSRRSGVRRPAKLPYDPSAPVNRPIETLAPTTGTFGEAATRMLPLAGEAWAVDDARRSLAAGDKAGAAVALGLGLLPFGGTVAAMRSAARPAFNAGASTMLTGGKTAARSPGSIPHAENIQGFHWSHEPQLSSTEPAMYGKGIKGAEADRLQSAPDVRNRSYYYTDETQREGGLGRHQYTGILKDVYPERDPLGIWRQYQNDPTAAERAIRAAGFKGYERNGAMAYFEPSRVAPHAKGTAPRPAAEAAPTITDATEVQVGSDLGTQRLPAELEAKRMGWLQDSNRIYDRLGLNPRSRVTEGSYLNPEGVMETNKVLVTDIPYTPEAEKAVDFVSTFRNIMLGQNARGGVAVKPVDTGENALRINVGPGDINKVTDIAKDVEAKGLFAVPSSEGMTIIGGDMPQSSLYELGHGLMQKHGVTRPSAYQGGQTSLYHPYAWRDAGEPEYIAGRGTLTEQELLPRIQSNPELAKQIELTGGLPQLARGVLSTEDAVYLGASPRGGSLPEDVLLLNRIVKEGGLEGLARWVRERGPLGLPAAGAVSLQPTDNQGR